MCKNSSHFKMRGVGKIHEIVAQLVEDRHDKLKTICLDEDPQQGRGP